MIDNSWEARPLSLVAASPHSGTSPDGFLKFHKCGSCSHASMPLHIWCPLQECLPFGLTPPPVLELSSSIASSSPVWTRQFSSKLWWHFRQLRTSHTEPVDPSDSPWTRSLLRVVPAASISESPVPSAASDAQGLLRAVLNECRHWGSGASQMFISIYYAC